MPNLMDQWKTYTKDFESPELFIEWSFYSLISSALQRRVWNSNTNTVTGLPSHNSIFLNQFIVLIGPPASGKSRMIKNVKAACEHELNKRTILDSKTKATVMVLDAITCTPDNITFEGLFEFLAKPERMDAMTIDVLHSDGSVKQSAYAYNAAAAMLEELGVMFTKNAEDVASVLCQAYDAGNMFRWTKTQGKDKINNICVNFLAGTTTDAIKRMLSNETVAEGLTSRIIFVYAPGPRFLRFSSPSTPQKDDAFIELVKHISKLATEVKGEIVFSPEAQEFIVKHYEAGNLTVHERVNHDKSLDQYFGRKKLHWIKLACVMHFANSDNIGSMTVSLATVQEALKLLNRTEVPMHLAFRASGVNQLHEVGEQMIAYLKQHGEVGYKRLLFTFSKDVDKAGFDELITVLEITDRITRAGNGFKLNPGFKEEK